MRSKLLVAIYKNPSIQDSPIFHTIPTCYKEFLVDNVVLTNTWNFFFKFWYDGLNMCMTFQPKHMYIIARENQSGGH